MQVLRCARELVAERELGRHEGRILVVEEQQSETAAVVGVAHEAASGEAEGGAVQGPKGHRSPTLPTPPPRRSGPGGRRGGGGEPRPSGPAAPAECSGRGRPGRRVTRPGTCGRGPATASRSPTREGAGAR